MNGRKKVAILVSAKYTNQKGLFNAVHNRCVYLRKIADYDIDVYMISSFMSSFFRYIKGRSKHEMPEHFEKDGIVYKILWRKNSLIDYILYHKIGFRKIISARQDNRDSVFFRDYDLLYSNSNSSRIALIAKQKFNVPYVVTWHGTDIHTAPYHDSSAQKKAIEILENASYNFFVSNSLRNMAMNLTKKFQGGISYNGVSSVFNRYSEEEKLSLKHRFNVSDKKVVAFVGNLIDIKNATSLPQIFCEVYKKYKDVVFWIIGDGPLKCQIEENMSDSDLPYVFWGNQLFDKMPKFYNCIDVLVLPSKQEGFGMVLLEAAACGASVVGSDRGGIPEAVGKENVFPIDEQFSENISNKIVSLLNNPIALPPGKIYRWEDTVKKENYIISKILNNT